jgi:acyl-coenzyme A synthetase/AMP-(fatty) acid ligase
MGDVGWRDDRGRIWFCGRKAHRVIVGNETMFTDSSEKVFDAHPLVYRSALVGPSPGPTLCVELEPGTVRPWPEIEAELRALAAAHPGFDRIRHYLRYDKRGGFPVDIRHNAKIGREQLREWAEGKLR